MSKQEERKRLPKDKSLDLFSVEQEDIHQGEATVLLHLTETTTAHVAIPPILVAHHDQQIIIEHAQGQGLHDLKTRFLQQHA